MQQTSKQQILVDIGAPDSVTEVSVSNGRFEKVASGLGAQTVPLEPGIYRIHWSRFGSEEQKLVEVTGREPDGKLNIDTKVPAVSTAAPLTGSRFGVIDNPEKLTALSIGPATIGANETSQIMLVLRDTNGSDHPFPVGSVSLHNPSGQLVANLNKGTANSDQRFAGIMVGLQPGVYQLRVDTGGLGFYELFVTTVAGWQTQVFLVCDDFYFGDESFRRPALRSASVLMQRAGTAFDADRPDARLAELALGALMSERDILDTSDMQDLLYGKFEDPMLGIYGAHLILQRKEIDWSLYRTVCQNLYQLVGPIPEIQAFSTIGEQERKFPSSQQSSYYGMPPMLVRSWRLLIDASRKQFNTIPKGSWSDRIAASIAGTRPWLLSRVHEQSGPIQQAFNTTSVKRAKSVMTEMMESIEPDDVSQIIQNFIESKTQLDSLESTILDVVAHTTKTAIPKESGRGFFERAMAGSNANFDITGQPDSSLYKIDAPSYSVARSALSLAEKLTKRSGFKIG